MVKAAKLRHKLAIGCKLAIDFFSAPFTSVKAISSITLTAIISFRTALI